MKPGNAEIVPLRIRVSTNAATLQKRKEQHIQRRYRIEDERPMPVNSLSPSVAVDCEQGHRAVPLAFLPPKTLAGYWRQRDTNGITLEKRLKRRRSDRGLAAYFFCSLVCLRMYASLVPPPETFRESRRSTRVPLRVVITVQGPPSLECQGETIVVNLHGALILTDIGLSVGMRISIHVYLTDKRATARVVYVDPGNLRRCGIELDEPQNTWGVTLSPDNWDETADFDAGRD